MDEKMLNWSIHIGVSPVFHATPAGGKLPVEENFKFLH